MRKFRVLIIDDSALMRELLTQILSSDPALEVVGTAMDPAAATDKILRLQPDVLTLDIEMPKMDGLTFLEKLMRVHPMPVVMVSSLTEKGKATTLRALELGAVDFVPKPKLDIRSGTLDLAEEIVAKVKGAARSRPRLKGKLEPLSAPAPKGPAPQGLDGKVIAIGASTGGTEALREVLTRLPSGLPGIVIVQHLPAEFTAAFAERLDSLCEIKVTEARSGDPVEPGTALIAPGNYHMELRRTGKGYVVQLGSGERVNHHRPSVDVLFRSCALAAGSKAIGVILTGMGDDGADGLLAMRKAGAQTLAQDEASCVVYGMPKEAVERGAVERIAPLSRISALITNLSATQYV